MLGPEKEDFFFIIIVKLVPKDITIRSWLQIQKYLLDYQSDIY